MARSPTAPPTALRPSSGDLDVFRDPGLARALFDSSEICLAVISPDGGFAAINAAGRVSLNLPEGAERSGERRTTLWPEQALANALSGVATTFELNVKGASLVIEITPLRDQNGLVTAALARWRGSPSARAKIGQAREARIRDLEAEVAASAERQSAMQSALIQSARIMALGEFVVTAAHDLNNVFSSAASALRILSRTPKGGRGGDIVRSGLETLDRGARVVRQMVDFTHGVDDETPTSVSAVLGQLEPLVRSLAGATIRVSIEQREEVWSIALPPSRLESVVLNLVVDVRDALPRGGALRIIAENIGPSACPVGLAPGEYVRVDFVGAEDDAHSENASKTAPFLFAARKRGFGVVLGLAAAFEIAEQAGGRCFVAGDVGQLGALSLYLPRSRPVDPVSEPSEAS